METAIKEMKSLEELNFSAVTYARTDVLFRGTKVLERSPS